MGRHNIFSEASVELGKFDGDDDENPLYIGNSEISG